MQQLLAVGADQEENHQLDSTHHVVDDARNCPPYCSRPRIMNSYLPRPFLYRMYLLTPVVTFVFNWLRNAMQTSILLSIAVVWWRWHHFSAPVGRLSWYV